jgi:hypothetical protein
MVRADGMPRKILCRVRHDPETGYWWDYRETQIVHSHVSAESIGLGWAVMASAKPVRDVQVTTYELPEEQKPYAHDFWSAVASR